MDYIKVSEPLMDEEEVKAVREVLHSGMLVSGKRVQAFEERFAGAVGVEHAVAVSSGTAALQLALTAGGVRPGDEVIVPSITFFASVTSVFHAGGRPVFADIDDDYCLDPESVRRQITPRTKAILPVHLYGYAAKMEELSAIAKEYSLFIVEDCAQAIGTKYKRKVAGSMGKAGAFSFFATKNMTTGEGGMITTNDQSLAEMARMMRSHGMKGHDDHLVLGYNYRMTEMEAAIGLVQLSKLATFNQRRRENSFYLYEKIRDIEWIRIQAFDPHIEHSFFWCPIFVREAVLGSSAAEVRKRLHERGIGTRHRYHEPLYRQPMLRENSPYERSYDVSCPFYGKTVRYEDLRFPNAEKYAGRVIGLPNHPGLRKVQLDRVTEALQSF